MDHHLSTTVNGCIRGTTSTGNSLKTTAVNDSVSSYAMDHHLSTTVNGCIRGTTSTGNIL
ncbi:hypothetical protein BvCmsB54A_00729 [Escherichia coli]|nr:hypothetical protein BvCmsC61A_05090 [Escherichia coli]GCK39672.1 hypothetical protein BvCmsB54A_00729 [Escherichia coli]